MFSSASYRFVLYGMGWKTQSNYLQSEREVMLAKKALVENEKMTVKYLQGLESHRDLINKICNKAG